jgi:hypothetical protein
MQGASSTHFAEYGSVGLFLCFVKMQRAAIFGPPLRVFTRELTITLVSTEVDPATGTIPPDQVVFRTRHIDRFRWVGRVAYEDKTTTGFLPPYTHRFQWFDFSSAYVPGVTTRKRFYDPFVNVLNPGIVDVSSPDFTPDTYFDAVKSNVAGNDFAPSQYYSAEPEWCFFPVELKPGQSLTSNTRVYEESAVSYDATAGAYTAPFLDDSVPTTGPSGSEIERTGGEIPFSTMFTTGITLLRI